MDARHERRTHACDGERHMIRSAISDTSAIVRAGVRQIADLNADMRVVAESGNAADTLHLVRRGECDLLLLDIDLPDKCGIEVLARVHALRPSLPVLVFSSLPEVQFAVPLLRAGATGYLPKQCCAGELTAAIRKVSQGGRYVSPATAEHLAEMISGDFVAAPHEDLSPREIEVLRLYGKGWSAAQIGERISISAKTVGTYRSRILEKMRLKSTVEMVQYVLRNNLA
jgi:DNA-binding NarL/FixJ family response regulator